MRYAHLLFCFFVIALVGCSHDPTTKDYYFPYKDFVTPTKYTYENKNDRGDYEYMIMSLDTRGGDTTLITQVSYTEATSRTTSCEKIVKDASILISNNQIIYNPNHTTSETSCGVKDSVVYKWDMKKGEFFNCTFYYTTPDNLYHVNVTRSRTYDKDTTIVDFEGKERPAIVLNDDYSMQISGREPSIKYSTKNYYAKGLGMVRFIMISDKNEKKDYVLQSIKKQD